MPRVRTCQSSRNPAVSGVLWGEFFQVVENAGAIIDLVEVQHWSSAEQSGSPSRDEALGKIQSK
jgi:hypothetical protein